MACCALAALLVTGPLSAAKADKAHDRAAIIALELELSHLLEIGDVDGYARHLASDYAQTTTEGELLSRDQSLAFWRKRGPGYRMTPNQMRVRIYGDTAILTARVTEPDNRSGDRITKTFVRVNGRWLLAALHGSHIAK